MKTTISVADVRLAQAATRELLAPLDSSDGPGWRQNVCVRVRELMGCDTVTMLLDEPQSPLLVGDGALSERAFREYAHWHPHIVGTARRREQGLKAWTREEVWPSREFNRAAYYHDFCIPFGNRDSAGMCAALPDGGESVLYVSSAKGGRFLPGGREVALLHLLQPAYAAGARARRALRAGRADIRLLDSLPMALAIFRLDGRLKHATPRFAALLRDPDTGPKLLQGAASPTAQVAVLVARRFSGELPRPEHWLDTPRGRLTLHATLLEIPLLGEAPLCLVTVSMPTAAPTVTSLQRRFRLTPREAEVTLLLANGYRNERIAKALAITEHTARRHTEQVLKKLEVTSRAEVAARLTR